MRLFKTKIIIFALFVFQTVHSQFLIQDSNVGETVIKFTHDEVSFESQGEYTKLIPSKGGTTADYGQPELPLFSTLIQVSQDKEYSVSYNVLSSHIIDDIKVFPFQNKDKTEAPGFIKYKDASFYAEDTVYPESILKVSDRLVMRDLELLNISVVPYRYNPLQSTLEVIDEIEIVVSITGENTNSDSSTRLPSRVFERLYSNLILNYETRDEDAEFQDPAILYICGGSSENNSSFQQLVEWRHQRGYVVYTASLSETGSSASAIKNYIQNAYNNFSPPPEYVALVGDVGGSYNIPTYYEDWGHDYWGNACEGDQPYSELVGNDLFPEIIIGRISVRSSSNISNVVGKIINYEKATYLGNLDGFYERAAVMGDPSNSGISTAITARYVEGILKTYGVEDVALKISGSGYSSWMEDQLEEGVLYMQYRGFGGVSGIDNGDINDANNGHKLPFATFLTCNTGDFAVDNTCLSEQFLIAGSVSNPKGAIAAVSTATGNTHTMFNNIIAMGMYDGLFPKKVGTAGASLVNGKLTLFNAYPDNPYNWVNAFCQWNNLMGDPSTHLWTDTPQVLDVNFEDDIPFGTNFLEIEVLNSFGDPVKGAMVTLLKGNDEIFMNNITDENGRTVINLEYQYGGEMTLTVTKQNSKPFIGTVTIITDGKLLNVDNLEPMEISDSGGDGIWNPGETIELAIPLHNYGLVGVSGVTAEISSNSENIDILDGVSSYGFIGAGEIDYGDVFQLSLSPSSMEREPLQLLLSIEDNSGDVWFSLVDLSCLGTHLAVTETSVSGSNYLQPGETSDMRLTLRNSGSLPTEELIGTLTSNSPEIQLLNPQADWESIEPGNSSSNLGWFTVKPNVDLIPGSVINLGLNIEAESGFSRNFQFSVEVGEVSVSDPLGPDSYGYYIYDSGDSGYEVAPSYDWIEISSIGDNLEIYDVGAGRGICSENNNIMCHSDADCDPWGWQYYGYCEFEETTKNVNLPFPFQFYGQSYATISVSSNGWIAFGDSEMESFRNYPVPGAGGPSPMLAVFWDDFKTSNGGNVFTYAPPHNQYFIIEWSDVRTENYNSLNSFQAILYNQTAPPYDDNEIKLQYKTFNNTSSGSFSGYTPIHGGYATIGIESHTSEIGLQYSFYNEYPAAAMELDDYDALFITTRPNTDFSEITIPIAYMDDWNLIGLPVMAENIDYTNLFPDAVENTLYAFDGSYVNQDNLFPGMGYWLRFNNSGSVNITGGNILDHALELYEGWNLITGISQTVYLSAINDPEGLLISGTLYGYGDMGYDESWMIEPGKGYWVRSSSDGIIYISGGLSSRVVVPGIEFHELEWVSINGRKLFLDHSGVSRYMIEYSLPPKPPQGGFDVRFTDDTKLCSLDECVIEIMNNGQNLDFECNLINNENWELVDNNGNIFKCEKEDVIEFSSKQETIVLRKSSIISVPTELSLFSAFPNPFNPITTIEFSVSELSTGSVAIYDIQGRKVETLLTGEILQGKHTIQWNASAFASGIYFIFLDSRGHIKNQKVVLMK